MEKFVLIYSNDCEHSKEILKKIKKYNFNKFFKLYNVDDNHIPDGIIGVPAIIIKDKNLIKFGDDVFDWVDNILDGHSNAEELEYNIKYNRIRRDGSRKDKSRNLPKNEDGFVQTSGGIDLQRNLMFNSVHEKNEFVDNRYKMNNTNFLQGNTVGDNYMSLNANEMNISKEYDKLVSKEVKKDNEKAYQELMNKRNFDLKS